MYAYLKGQLEEITNDNCIIEVNNIGYNVRISESTAAQLPSLGSVIKMYTYTSVREDAISLLGFLDSDDLAMFRQLITVSGIGPKVAQSILGAMDANAVRMAVISGDVKSLSAAPGVGKRSAERIIIDLKGKVDAEDVLVSRLDRNTVSELSVDGVLREACEALTALGYSQAESMKAVKNIEISDSMDVETVLKLALKELF